MQQGKRNSIQPTFNREQMNKTMQQMSDDRIDLR
jgi:hypothetical protein